MKMLMTFNKYSEYRSAIDVDGRTSIFMRIKEGY